MKDITFVVPCYNAEAYMKRCLDSLLFCGEEGEIIIIDDGSTDNTGEIAEEYAAVYPNIVTVVHKTNGGHGSGINAGLKIASGRFFKVVDSDDWLDRRALEVLMRRLKQQKDSVDMVVCNYIYDHLYENRQKTVCFRNVFAQERVCGWKDMGFLKPSQYLVMHALIFRTALLQESGVKLPAHTFYVDNLFAYKPLPYVERILYLDIDLYHYFLGREDQSVNETVMLGRIDQHLRVTSLMIDDVDVMAIENRRLRHYMENYLSMMMCICSVFLRMRGGEEDEEDLKGIWAYLKEQNPSLYRRVRTNALNLATNLPTEAGEKIGLKGYQIAQKIFKFN